MNDDFLGGLRGQPTPEFEAQLRERLRRQEEEGTDAAMNYDDLPARAGRRPWPILVGGLLAAAVLALVLSPTLRASANAFLDLFRVRSFAVVSVDPARLERLHNGSIDFKGLLADHTETLQEPGPPRIFTDVASAGSAAGFAIRVPSPLPPGLTAADTVSVRGTGEARFTAQTTKLREVLDALGLNDVTIPSGLDGAQIGVRTSPSVTVLYRSGTRRVSLLQSRSPEVSLPQGVDLAEVGEIGLRIAGLDRGEAARFARSIDWHSTMLVPLPTNAGSFREVDVRGNKGLLITTNRDAGPDSARKPQGSMLMWAEGDMVYALCGTVSSENLIEMATNLQ